MHCYKGKCVDYERYFNLHWLCISSPSLALRAQCHFCTDRLLITFLCSRLSLSPSLSSFPSVSVYVHAFVLVTFSALMCACVYERVCFWCPSTHASVCVCRLSVCVCYGCLSRSATVSPLTCPQCWLSECWSPLHYSASLAKVLNRSTSQQRMGAC